MLIKQMYFLTLISTIAFAEIKLIAFFSLFDKSVANLNLLT